VHAFSLDALSYHCTLPPLRATVSAINFVPETQMLLVVGADGQMLCYDVERRFTISQLEVLGGSGDGSKAGSGKAGGKGDSGKGDSSKGGEGKAGGEGGVVNAEGAAARKGEVVQRIVFNPADKTSAVLCAQTWLCRVSLPIAASTPAALGAPKQQKRKRDTIDTAADATASTLTAANSSAIASAGARVSNYGPMVCFDYLAADTAVVVEVPWLRVMQHFPPALYRHQFGT